MNTKEKLDAVFRGEDVGEEEFLVISEAYSLIFDMANKLLAIIKASEDRENYDMEEKSLDNFFKNN